MDKPIFLDYETKIYAAYLNAVAATVWDALGEATNPQEARQFIGAVDEAPTDGSSYARQNAQWVEIQVGNLHNDLTGRSASDAHPVSAITGLQTSLDQINLDISGKAPESAGTASGTSFSPSGTVSSTNVQSAIAEVSGDVTALQATVAGLGTPAASAVTFSPTGTVAATNVQAAIAEVASEKVALSGGTMTGPLTTTALTSNGQVESKATGFKFPDATVQISAGYTKAEIDSRTGPGTIAASCVVTVSGGVPTKSSSYNVGVVGRPSVGQFNVTLEPPLPDTKAAVVVTPGNLATGAIATVSSLTTSNVGLAFYTFAGALADPSSFSVIVTRQP